MILGLKLVALRETLLKLLSLKLTQVGQAFVDRFCASKNQKIT